MPFISIMVVLVLRRTQDGNNQKPRQDKRYKVLPGEAKQNERAKKSDFREEVSLFYIPQMNIYTKCPIYFYELCQYDLLTKLIKILMILRR